MSLASADGRSAGNQPGQAVADFGPVLYEQRVNRGNIGNAIFLIVVGTPFVLVIFVANAPISVRLGMPALGLAIVVFASTMLWRNWMHVLLSERGIREFRQGRDRTLSFADVD